MPMTNLARAELEALVFSAEVPFDSRKPDLSEIRAAAEAFERMYAKARYQDIPKAELEAQRQRDVILWNADRSAAFARSPAHGEFYDLVGRYLTLNTAEQARLNELWREVYPPVPAASSPIAA